MYKNKIIIVFLLVSLSIFSETGYEDLFIDLTDDNSKDSITKENKSNFNPDIGFKLSLTGDHDLEFHIPVTKDNINFDTYYKAPKLKNDFGIELSVKDFDLVSHWELDLILNKWGEWDDLLEVTPLENYLSWSPWKFILIAGFQKYSWGTADGINPTDNINPRDYRNSIDPKKLSVFSGYVAFYPFDFFSMEVVYIPFFQKHKFPEDIIETVEDIFPSADVNIKDTEFKPEYFGLGGKLNFYFRYADFSFSYLTKVDPNYSADIDMEKDTNSGYSFYSVDSIDLINRRLHYFGVDFKTNINIFGIWVEICYTLTDDYFMNKDDIRNHQFQWITGFDFNYGPGAEFYLSFQYFGIYNPGFYYDFYNEYDDGEPEYNKDKEYYETYYYRSITDSLADIREGVLQSIVLEMKWPVINSLLTPSIAVMYTIPLIYNTNREARYGSLYLNPELDIKPIDSFHIKVGADLFYSWHKLEDKLDINYDGMIGSNYKNTSIYIEIIYKWGFDFHK